MKILKCFSITALVLMMSAFSVNAQKFGHINSQELIAVMPETKVAQAELEGMRDKLEAQSKTMQEDFSKKIEEYQQMVSGGNTPDPIRTSKEAELQEIQQRMRNFEQDAIQNLQKKEAELLTPIIEKAQKAVQEVGKEQGLLYIFELGAGALVYKADESIDVLPLVKKKLGLQ